MWEVLETSKEVAQKSQEVRLDRDMLLRFSCWLGNAIKGEIIVEHILKHEMVDHIGRAFELENLMDKSRNILKRNARKRLQKGYDVKVQLLFIDIIRHFERIGDYSLNISQALRQIE